jgi:hypothetical protein
MVAGPAVSFAVAQGRPGGLVFLVVATLLLACARVKRLEMPLTRGDPWAFGEESAPPMPEPKEGAEPFVRFAAVGDMGDSTLVQAMVARGVKRACDGKCQFVLLLGDNLYESGVSGKSDEEELSCLVESYPTSAKYLVLGNHDYTIINPSLPQARNQLGWIRREAKRGARGTGARGQHHFYRFRAGNVRLVGIDTNFLLRARLDASYRDLYDWLGTLRPRRDEWVIVFGHHAYVSNGGHGNAGAFREGPISVWPGRFFGYFLGSRVFGRADLYIAGHDHNLQFFANVDDGPTAQVVSGSGARCNPRGPLPSERAMMERYGYGFALIEATRDVLQVGFHDARGRRFWGAWRERRNATWKPMKGFDARVIETAPRCEQERVGLIREADRQGVRACPRDDD